MPNIISSLAKHLGIFLGVFLILFFVFSTAGMKQTTHSFYANTHGKVLNALLPKVNLTFKPAKGIPTDWNQTMAEFYNKADADRQIAEAQKQGIRELALQVKEHIYHLNILLTPFVVFLLALIIATPISWKEKLWAILWGNVLLFIFLVIKMYFNLLFVISANKIGVYEFGEGLHTALFYTKSIMQFGFSTMMILIIWAAVIYRKDRMKGLKERLGIIGI